MRNPMSKSIYTTLHQHFIRSHLPLKHDQANILFSFQSWFLTLDVHLAMKQAAHSSVDFLDGGHLLGMAVCLCWLDLTGRSMLNRVGKP